MTTIIEYFNGLLEGCALIALALSAGGIAHGLVVLRALGAQARPERLATESSIAIVTVAAAVLAGCRLVQLGVKPWALAGNTGDWALEPFLHTDVFQAGMASVGLAACLSITAFWLRKDVGQHVRWLAIVSALAVFMVNEAWLSHAASRLEGSGPLMVGTMVHMLGAIVWAGGIAHLLLFWRMGRQDPEASSKWPSVVARFSPLGISCMVLIVAAGLFLAWHYVRDWRGLIGTGYGNMLAVKLGLFTVIVLLAALNFLATERWRRGRDATSLRRGVPIYIEVEIILAGAVLFTAAALASFPPAVDTPRDAATSAEIWSMFAPKVPHLAGPERVWVEAPELTDLKSGEIGRKEDMRWDRFNHNVSGVVLLAIVGFVLLERTGRVPLARHWPLLFVAFSILVVIFANPDDWPLGPLGFMESARDAKVVQHWMAALVMLGLGVFEWRARRVAPVGTKLAFVFPILCIVGGLVLLTHSHQILELKREFLIQSTHVAMGFVGVIAGCSRWLQLRLPAPHDRIAGHVMVASLTLVALILLFYVTPE